jgi:predicted MFS family arabinose efflux permease
MALHAFRFRPFRFFWAATVLWNLTRWMDMVVIGWVVLELTNSPWAVALIGFYRSLPLLLLGMLGGAIADRFGRRQIIISSQIVNTAVAIGLFALLTLDWLRFEHAVIANLLLGITWAIDWPARRSLVPDLVGRDLVLSAVALDNISQNLTRILGPLISGAITAYVGGANAYAVIVALTVVQVILLLKTTVPSRAVSASAYSVVKYLRDGWHDVRQIEPVMGVLAITVLMNCFVFPYQQLLPVIARDGLGTDAFGLGVLGAASGVGALIGSIAIAARGRIGAPGLVFALGSLAMAGFLALFALAGHFGLAVGLLALAGLAQSSFGTFQSSIILLSTSDALRGRAMGILTLAIGSAPIGLLEIGALSEVIGASYALAINAAVCAVLILLVTILLPGLRRLRAE